MVLKTFHEASNVGWIVSLLAVKILFESNRLIVVKFSVLKVAQVVR